MTRAGLQDLPLELLQEILSYIPDLPLPFTPQPSLYSFPFWKAPLSADEPRVQRTSTLRSLSQTCRIVRQLTRPLAWEVIEVVSFWKEDTEKLATQRETSAIEQQQLGRELWRQLRVVLEDDSLRKNLRRVSVIITASSARAALKMFEAFPTFPNLHTVQLFSLSAGRGSARLWNKDLSSSLRNLNTPLRSVKNLVLPEYAKGLLRHCPALEAVVATLGSMEKGGGRYILKEIFDHCPSVKLIQGLPMKWPTDAELLVKSCAQLVCLHLDDSLYEFDGSEEKHQQLQKRTFQTLSALKQVRHITLFVGVCGPFEIHPMHQLSIMHCIMILGGVFNADLEDCEEENVGDPFTSPFPAALLPVWFLKKIIPRKVIPDQGADMLLKRRDHGSVRTLTVDIDGIHRPVAIFSVVPPAEGNAWPRLLSMQVGYRSNDMFEELYDLIDIPLDIDRQPDPLSNIILAKPQPLWEDKDDDDLCTIGFD